MSQQVAEVLRKALEAFGPNGENRVIGFGGVAPQCCAVSSFDRAGFSLSTWKGNEAYEFLCRAAGVKPGFLAIWHDKLTWPDIKAAYEKAIALAEAA